MSLIAVDGTSSDPVAAPRGVELDCCPTCLSYGGQPLPGVPASSRQATCPTCGIASVEWTLIEDFDALLNTMVRFDALDHALTESGGWS